MKINKKCLKVSFLIFLNAAIFTACNSNPDAFKDSSQQSDHWTANGINQELDQYQVEEGVKFENPRQFQQPEVAKKPLQVVTATAEKEFWIPRSLRLSEIQIEWDQNHKRVFVNGRALWQEPLYQSSGDISFALVGNWNSDAGVADLVLVKDESRGVNINESVRGRLYCVGINQEGFCESTIAEIFIRVNKLYIFSGQIQKLAGQAERSDWLDESQPLKQPSNSDKSHRDNNVKKKQKTTKLKKTHKKQKNKKSPKNRVAPSQKKEDGLIGDSLTEALNELNHHQENDNPPDQHGGDVSGGEPPQDSTVQQPPAAQDLEIVGGTNETNIDELFHREDVQSRQDEVPEPVPLLPVAPTQGVGAPPPLVPPSELSPVPPFETHPDHELEETLQKVDAIPTPPPLQESTTLDPTPLTTSGDGAQPHQAKTSGDGVQLNQVNSDSNAIPIPRRKPLISQENNQVLAPESSTTNKDSVPNAIPVDASSVPKMIPIPRVKPIPPSTPPSSAEGSVPNAVQTAVQSTEGSTTAVVPIPRVKPLAPESKPSVSQNTAELRPSLAQAPQRSSPSMGKEVRGGKLIGPFTPFQSIGTTNKGYLKNPSSLAEMISNISKLGVEDKFPLRAVNDSDNNHYGNYAMMEFLLRSAFWINRLSPGTALEVNDISHKTGGYLDPHASHQNGLDADIGFFMKNQSTNYYGKNVVTSNGLDPKFDRELQWKFFKTLMKYYRNKIFYIFVHPRVKQAMCAEAEKSGDLNKNANPQTVAIAREALRRLFPEYHHYNHFHVRVRCPKERVYRKGSVVYRSRCLDEVGDLAAVTGCNKIN